MVDATVKYEYGLEVYQMVFDLRVMRYSAA